ncbi:ABC-type ATPase involved in cell division [Nonomuraea thailandensis]|uniref:ABC-type ATPase involved in cell division n=1 Tax=Nonomuraea thailandensis TaxID=1188745 RepID=A0A9X2GL04_9ACTN|nr:GNAT family N-acetyltransferase [Nonomuraea thailandensis]MCP2359745.1 ABC-type ATPase involved in cell division [Nonomuraea thailandensis]
MRAEITVSAPVHRTARVLQIQGLFDVPVEERLSNSWAMDLPIEERPWSVGLIVGPSGAGKTSIARHLWPDHIVSPHTWSDDRSLVDDFPADMSIKDIVALLGAVGLSSPPAWLRPYRTLSNGEAFRATIARALAESGELVVIDEFTSVVDRQVARVASHTIQKTVRRSDRQFVAVTCHYDVLEWLQPDWVLDVSTGSFEWRSVQPRPVLRLEIRPVDGQLWPVFARHHYLSTELHRSSKKFAGFIDGEPVAFLAYRHFQHPATRNLKMEHRLVVLPDYQGLGIGVRFSEWMGQRLYEQGFRYRSVSSHPALIAYRSGSPRWRMIQGQKKLGTRSKHQWMHAQTLDPRRLGVVSFEYVAPR